MPKRMKKKGNAKVHNDLEGFNIKINAFGEMESNFEVDKLNVFLDENVYDKKLNSKEEE